MSREELLWDHTGEELDDPLIGSYGTEEEEGVRYRYDHLLHDWMVDEKHGLLSCFDNYTSKMATEARLKNYYTPMPKFYWLRNVTTKITYNYREW